MRNVVTGDAGRLTATRTKTLAAQRAKFRIARRCGRRITLLTALGSIDEFKRLPSRSHHANLTQTVSTLEKPDWFVRWSISCGKHFQTRRSDNCRN